jgi:hypothetical protein
VARYKHKEGHGLGKVEGGMKNGGSHLRMGWLSKYVTMVFL